MSDEKKKGFRLNLIDVDNRLKVKFDKTQEIETWGADNAYPSLIVALLQTSNTGRRCWDESAKNIRGKGFGFEGANEIIVNNEGMTINQLLTMASKEFAGLNNFFVHVNYNALYQITSATLKPCTDIRVGKRDSRGYAGKLVDYPNWDKSIDKSVKKTDFVAIDRFNPNPEVIQAQVDKAGGWNKYKGQILHVKGDFSKVYSTPDAESAIFDLDTEYRCVKFKNSGIKTGMWGTRIVMTHEFESDFERREFEKTLQGMMGEEDTNALMVMEGKGVTDNLEDELKVVDFDSNFDDKRLQFSESTSQENIMTALGVPPILVRSSKDNSIFGNSGELIKQARLELWENKQEERAMMIDGFKRIFSRWHEPLEINDWSILPIIQQNQA